MYMYDIYIKIIFAVTHKVQARSLHFLDVVSFHKYANLRQIVKLKRFSSNHEIHWCKQTFAVISIFALYMKY